MKVSAESSLKKIVNLQAEKKAIVKLFTIGVKDQEKNQLLNKIRTIDEEVATHLFMVFQQFTDFIRISKNLKVTSDLLELKISFPYLDFIEDGEETWNFHVLDSFDHDSPSKRSLH